MNKQTIYAIVLTLLFVGMSFFAYDAWSAAKQYEELYDESKVSAKEQYNRAEVKYVKAMEDIEFLDKRLKEEQNKPADKVIQKVYVYVETKVEGSGALAPVTSTVATSDFTYSDYRLDASIDVEKLTLDYKLSQKFHINVYKWKGDDYRFEMVEMDDDGKIVATYKPTKFTVTKVLDDKKQRNYGFNLMLGGDGIWNPGTNINWQPHLLMNFVSYGASHLDSDWRFLSLGAGTKSVLLSPVSYRISNQIPLFSDLFLHGLIGFSYDGDLGYGLGIGSTL